MKTTLRVFISILFSTISPILSWGQKNLDDIRGFIDEPLDSIAFDLKDYVMPASDVFLQGVCQCGDYYFFSFREKSYTSFSHEHSFLIAADKRNLEPIFIKLPESQDDFSSIMTKNGSLYVRLLDHRYYCFNLAEWMWVPHKNRYRQHAILYEDTDWKVKHIDRESYGDATWFIDKHAKNEYAFPSLMGNILKGGDTFYVVNDTRIYGLRDPAIGFRCSSSTSWRKANKAIWIEDLFVNAGYTPLDNNFLPIVHFDSKPAETVVSTINGTAYNYYGSTPEYAESDTSIIGSFVASDTLFCSLNTTDGIELMKLEGGHLNPVHRFIRNTGGYSPMKFIDRYPNTASTSTNGSQLILLNMEAGHSELFEICKDGNRLIDLSFNPGGLRPVEDDGFETLLSFYIDNWGRLHLEDFENQEKRLGGGISYRNLEPDRNSFPPENIFDASEKYHIDIISKKVKDAYLMESEYWVKESDKTIPAVFHEWSGVDRLSSFDTSSKFDEIAGIITKYLGPGQTVPVENGEIPYVEWHDNDMTVRLYHPNYDIRLIIF